MVDSQKTITFFSFFIFGILIGSLNFWFYADQMKFASLRKLSMDSLRDQKEVKLGHRRKEWIRNFDFKYQ